MIASRACTNWAQLLLVVSLSAFGADDDRPPPMPAYRCPANVVDLAENLPQLKKLAAFCAEHRDSYAIILKKLGEEPFPSVPKLSLQTERSDAPRVRASYRGDVYFNVFDSYPESFALAKLREFIDILGQSYEIERVILRGRADHAEIDTGNADILREARIDQVYRYFTTAGLRVSVPLEVGHQDALHPDTTEGRARDRLVEVEVIVLKNK